MKSRPDRCNKGLDFKEAAQLVDEQLGEAPLHLSEKRPAPAEDRKRDEVRKLWDRTQPITLDDPAGRYLHRRTGLTEFPACLRFAPDERYFEPDEKASWHPAMIAKVDPSDTGSDAREAISLFDRIKIRPDHRPVPFRGGPSLTQRHVDGRAEPHLAAPAVNRDAKHPLGAAV